jgi:manganese oxidase
MPNVNTKIVLLLSVVVFLAMLIPATVNIASVNAQQNNATNNNNNNSSTDSTSALPPATTKSNSPYNYGYLEDFNYGRVATLENGTTVRNYTLMVSENTLVPVTTDGLNGTQYPGWTFNYSIPGPTMRMTEGDHISITVVNPVSSQHSHSMHMHSVHSPIMDGTYSTAGDIKPGTNFTYSFTASPAGVYPYHCHVSPIVDHINHGLYGMMIIDPKVPRTPAHELVMIMNSYDFDINQALKPTFQIPNKAQSQQIFDIANRDVTNDDGTLDEQAIATNTEEREGIELGIERENEMYTVNGVAFQYMKDPIVLQKDEPVRIYLLSMTEFDPVNNFHLHSAMFKYIPEGTEQSAEYTTDIVTLSQGDRGIIEFTPHNEGLMMFHSHIAEFAELGWMSNFKVVA